MKIIIIDDDIFVTSSLRTILEMDADIQVVALGNSGKEALSLYDKYLPDLVLMDIQMGQDNGLTTASTILSTYPSAKIIMLTTFQDEEYIIKSLSIGTKGYLLKQDYEHLIPAIKAVYSGQAVYGPDIVDKLPHLLQPGKHFDYQSLGLSVREFELVKLISQGLSNKEIAKQMFLSEGTIRNYLSNILDKLQLRDRTQLAVYYLKRS